MKQHWFPSHLVEIERAECLELLARTSVGRVAYCSSGSATVLPVNHAMVGDGVIIRISPRSELGDHLERGGPRTLVSYQVDEFDDYTQSGWSVLVQGHAQVLDPSDLPDLEEVPVPWAEGERSLLMLIRPDRITGRRLMPV